MGQILVVVFLLAPLTTESFRLLRHGRHVSKNHQKPMILSAVPPKSDAGIPVEGLEDVKPQRLSDIPLIPATDISNEAFIWPIPLGHVPEALRTCSIYLAPTNSAITTLQKSMLLHRVGTCLCGFLYNETIGCIAAITQEEDTIVYRGECTFRIVEIESTIPYTVATVELMEPLESKGGADDESIDTLKDLLLDWAQLMLEKAQQPKTPLEESLLGVISHRNVIIAQERVSVIEAAPLQCLVDLVPDLVGFSNAQRCTLMSDHSNVSSRIQYVRGIVKERLGMERARKLADSITDSVDEPAKDLRVGNPTIPSWSKQIRSGTRLEYFWNVEIGWCSGTVTEQPVMIVDELLINVRFDDDGSTHRLPFSTDDMLRWRPLREPFD